VFQLSDLPKAAAFGGNAMKVAVFGSMRDSADHKPTDADKAEFRRACEAIGFALAKAGHEISIATMNPETADPHVYKGGLRARRRTVGMQYRPLEPQTGKIADATKTWPTREEIPSLGLKTVLGSFDRVHAEAVKDADAVLIIGGASGAENAAMYAWLAGKPVLPVATFKGTALKVRNRDQAKFDGALSRDIREKVFERWDDKASPKAVVQALSTLRSNNPNSADPAPPLTPSLVLFGVGVGLVVLWIFLVSHIDGAFSPTRWLIPIVAGLMGTVARVAMQARSLDSVFPRAGVVMELAVLGIYSAFLAMNLYYFAGPHAGPGTNAPFGGSAEILSTTFALTVIAFGAAWGFEKMLPKFSGIGANMIPKALRGTAPGT
jgi:hypothetical protein